MPARISSTKYMFSPGTIGLIYWRDTDDGLLRWSDTVTTEVVYWAEDDFKEGVLYDRDDIRERGMLDAIVKRKKKKKKLIDQDVHERMKEPREED